MLTFVVSMRGRLAGTFTTEWVWYLSLPLMVITMNWTEKYVANELIAQFEDEREFVDAAFILIVMQNFGVWLTPDKLRADEPNPTLP
jgi:hypothetical protein